MSYQRRVLKSRPASRTDQEWLEVIRRGKFPCPDFVPRDGRSLPPVDVRDLVDLRLLSDLAWRIKEIACAMLKPKTSTSADGSSMCDVQPCELLLPFSEVWEFLTKSAYSDGTKRATGSMTVKLGSAGLQVTLTDPTSASYCCLSATSLQDALLAFEIGLKENSLAWRASNYSKTRK